MKDNWREIQKEILIAVNDGDIETFQHLLKERKNYIENLEKNEEFVAILKAIKEEDDKIREIIKGKMADIRDLASSKTQQLKAFKKYNLYG